MSEEKKITLSESQFEGLLSRIKKLESSTDTSPSYSKKDRVKEHVGYMRSHDDELVVDYKNLVYRKNELKETEIFMPLVLQSGKEVEVNYNEFLEDNNKVKVKILKRKSEEIISRGDRIMVENPDPAHNKSFSSREEELEVVEVKHTFDVEIKEGKYAGKKITIMEKALNM